MCHAHSSYQVELWRPQQYVVVVKIVKNHMRLLGMCETNLTSKSGSRPRYAINFIFEISAWPNSRSKTNRGWRFLPFIILEFASIVWLTLWTHQLCFANKGETVKTSVWTRDKLAHATWRIERESFGWQQKSSCLIELSKENYDSLHAPARP